MSKIDIHKKKIVDSEIPLTNDTHETFCIEYVRLDIEEQIFNKRARRIRAYRLAFPETKKDSDSTINSRATSLLARKTIKDRIKNLYEKEGTSVENEFNWTRSKSEGLLLGIAYDEKLKTADRLKAISELNKMRGIDVPFIKEENKEEEDTVDSFFSKIAKVVSGD